MKNDEKEKKELVVKGRKLLSLDDFECIASSYRYRHPDPKTGLKCSSSSLLPSLVVGYYSGGAADERQVERNHNQYHTIFIKPRCLVDVQRVDMGEVRLLQNVYEGGLEVSMPIGIAPTAFQRLAHADGEIATAKASFGGGTCMCLSTMASTAMEEVAKANTDGIRFFQLYVFRDRSITQMLLRRAESAGYKAIVLTVDAPTGLGRRETDIRQEFQLPRHIRLANLTEALARMPDAQGSSLMEYTATQFDPTLTWESVGWLRTQTTLPIILKGIMCVEDALLAAKHGAAAVWVSNHGGRQLDDGLSTIEVLPGIAKALRGTDMDIYIDGGIRRGSDVFKAIALGATCAFIGRPVLWGLAAGGTEGVESVLHILQQELLNTMQLAGVSRLADLGPQCLVSKSIPDIASYRTRVKAHSHARL